MQSRSIEIGRSEGPQSRKTMFNPLPKSDQQLDSLNDSSFVVNNGRTSYTESKPHQPQGRSDSYFGRIRNFFGGFNQLKPSED